MKKLLVLGGAKAQVPLIQAAKRERYYVVLCDWTTTNPGIALCDKHYQVSTLDLDAVLRVADIEKPDGVVSNSEPAMENVSAVAEAFHLVGNSVDAVKCVLSKDGFRTTQQRAGVFSPKHLEAETWQKLNQEVDRLCFPVIMKPSQNSGSRGTMVFQDKDEAALKQHFKECKELSRNGFVTVEEYVPMPSLEVIEGDVFVHNGIFIWDGVFRTHRSPNSPFIPMTYSFPHGISPERFAQYQDTVRRIYDQAGICYGECNVEAYFTQSGELFVIEINPRQGGNGIPFMVQTHSGIDLYRLLVTTAVGDDTYFNEVLSTERRSDLFVRHMVFSHESGVFHGVKIAEELKPFVKEICISATIGSPIGPCTKGADALGFVDLCFTDYAQQETYCRKMEQYITPDISCCDAWRCRNNLDDGLSYEQFSAFIHEADQEFLTPLSRQVSDLDAYIQKLYQFGTIAYLWDQEKQIIGGAVIGYTDNTPDQRSYITQACVLREYRGKGIAQQTLREFERICRRKLLRGMWLTTEKQNVSAQRTYESFGFQPTGINARGLVVYEKNLLKQD